MAYDRAGTLALPHACEAMAWAVPDPRTSLHYLTWSREFVMVDRGSSASLALTFCPFCGERLPASLRDEYFEGTDEAEAQDRGALDGDAWWRARSDLLVPLHPVEVEGPQVYRRRCTAREAALVERICRPVPGVSASSFQAEAWVDVTPDRRRVELAEGSTALGGPEPQVPFLMAEAPDGALVFVELLDGAAVALEVADPGPEPWAHHLDEIDWTVHVHPGDRP